ncbi:secretion protein HylD [Rhizobium sp. Leaf384]|uniref:efflux RND transporter periplasmic adaptor subunit n=1 Tax=unclassified Rhizobium TaxID=2613769 RepID=UPI00071565FF|nr:MULTISPECIES: efflux RND transporter periplasmic adaptor subunit [unclassified Rhizobium]KQS79387.1 secretion protein HylD [Rhizobium sp. Leaf384]KQS82956.1 secretion protein HylD [Rhizobium sp. Leaf383]
MQIWKQLILSLVILLVGLGVWVRFAPSAGPLLVSAGVPGGMVALVAPATTGQDKGQGRSGPSGTQRAAAGNQTPLVVTEAAGTALVNDRLNAIGNGEAILSVSVTPLSTGNLTEVLVKSGDRIEKGQVIAKLDSDEQVLAVAQAKVLLDAARDKVERNRRLGNAVSIATLREAEFAEQAAELALKTAELDLARRAITSPSKGVVGIITVNPGDYVTTSTPIAVVDDRSQILVDFWVPERFANNMKVGQEVSAVAVAQVTRQLTGAIHAIDNRIDQASRTLRVRARLDNPDDSLRAGMSFSVTVRFPGDSYPTVNPLAVQWSADGSYVWRVVDSKAERVPVTIIQRNSDKVLVDAKLEKGDMVATEGVQRLRDGGEVKVANAPARSTKDGGEQKMSSAQPPVTATEVAR